MAIKLRHLRSGTQGKLPPAADLDFGQIAVNTHANDPFLSIKDGAGNVRRIGGATIGGTAPLTPFDGQLWVDTRANPPAFKMWDATNTKWVSVAPAVPSASETHKGIAEIATQAEVTTGTDGTRIVTPKTLKAAIHAIPSASETVKGIAEIATQAEVTTGTDDTRIVSPKKLKAAIHAIPSASEAHKGLAEIATQAEVNAGTDATRIVTPKTAKATFVNASGDTMTGDLKVGNSTKSVVASKDGTVVATGDIQMASLNEGQLAGYRNKFMNSSFVFDQYRNLAIDANGNTLGEGDFACDRWIVSGNPGGNWQNVTRTKVHITGVSTSGIGLRFNDTSNTTTAKRLLQGIELTNPGQNSQFVEGSTWTLSFWCDTNLSSTVVNAPVFRKVSTTSTAQVPITSTPPSHYKVGRTIDGFTHYSATFTVNNSVSSSSDAANIVCLSVIINLPPKTNSVIVAPQFERGPVATPFEQRPIGTELILCQRYYQVIRAGGKTGSSIPRPGSGHKILFMNIAPAVPVRALDQYTVTSGSIYYNANTDATSSNGISSYSAGLSINRAAKAGITYDHSSSIGTAYGYQFTVTWNCEL